MRTTLRAGPVTAVLDGIDLRYVSRAGIEAVRRIYVGVRDHNWETIPGVASDVSVEAGDDRFQVTFSCRHARGPIDFSWRGAITGSPDGVIAFAMDGEAATAFAYNRIGFCVLHPWRESLGRTWRGHGPDGDVGGTFPDLVAPQGWDGEFYVPLIGPVDALETDLAGGATARLTFSGDLWECEDQRNWTDASFKTYCTPLRLGFPHRLEAGGTLSQRVLVAVDGPDDAPVDDGPDVAVGAAGELRLGAIGLQASRGGAGPAARLASLGLDHLRVDVRPDAAGGLGAARAEAEAAGAGLEVALHAAPGDDLGAVREALDGARIDRVLVFARDAASATPEEVTPGPLLAEIREGLGLDGVPVGGGSDMNFCELNRGGADPALDVVAYAAAAQVHAFDERSVLETPEGLAETVRAARVIAGVRPLAVGPVTLRPRFNAVATGDALERAAGDDFAVDPRQHEPFAAVWLLAALAGVARHGAESSTWAETIGPAGVLTAEGAPTPVSELLAGLCGWHGARVLPVTIREPLAVAALALEHDDGARLLLVGNLRPEPATVTIAGSGPVMLGPYDIARIEGGSAP